MIDATTTLTLTGDQLSIADAEQWQAARALAETGLAAPLGRLAQISPREPRVTRPQGCRALRIGDLDQHLGIALSALVQAHWSRLATGQVQRFVPPGAVDQVVLPVPEQDLAETWHAALVDLLAKRRESQGRMQGVLAEVARLYDAMHPAIGGRT